MILINLLPHREAKKKARKIAFFILMGLVALAALAALGFGYLVLNNILDRQNERNQYLEGKNKELDAQIKDIAALRAEIEALRARQNAVEDLQADRNVPVHLLNELVRQTPEGIYLKEAAQTGQSVKLTGFAQSQERVADYLRNTGNASQWLEKPVLEGTKATDVRVGPTTKDIKRLFEFTMSFSVKRPRDVEAKKAASAASAGAAPGIPATPASAASGPKV